ncbi:hypothetical protein [Dyadobacter sp. LHD-138]|uniref:hypothetical protein n=1 Tax=Dyadobacter sp. LHD-138 TaxID=3071413 RepID=UPI0027DF49FE|nr:hypothetical protein [Dyadobacter sp. LHD-138]MDQ6482221.1 hypothetical protein [Dyadobacter sp. LHD-138]
MGQITRGLGKIEIGEIAADGGVATVWERLGDTDRDSTAVISEEDPTRDELHALEYDAAADVDITEGAITVSWTLLNADLAALAVLWGGAVEGVGAAQTWERSGVANSLERSIKVTPKKGYVITVVRASIVAKINYDLTKPGKMAVDIVATIMQPTKADTKPVKFGPLVA